MATTDHSRLSGSVEARWIALLANSQLLALTVVALPALLSQPTWTLDSELSAFLAYPVPVVLSLIAALAFNLQYEANPIARALLDSGHPLPVVYLFGAACQVLVVVVSCLLTIAVLRHRRRLIDSVRYTRSITELLKHLIGGRHLTYRQWLLPMRYSELPEIEFYTWFAGPILLTHSIYRFYLGLEWFGFVSGMRLIVGCSSALLGITIYCLFLWKASRTASTGCNSDS